MSYVPIADGGDCSDGMTVTLLSLTTTPFVTNNVITTLSDDSVTL